MNSKDYTKGYDAGVSDMEDNLRRADVLIIDLTALFVDGRNTEAAVDETLADLKEYLDEYCTVGHEFDAEYFNGMPSEPAAQETDAVVYSLEEGELFADWMQRHGIKPANEEDYLNYTRIFTGLVNDMKDDSLPEAVPVDEVEPSVIKIFDVEYHEVTEWEDDEIPF